MSHRRPTKAERERAVSLDLLADWRAYAEPLSEPKGGHDWRYFGTITLDGQTGALAWRAGGYGVGNGTTVRELGLWGRIKVEALLMNEPPGHSNAPRFAPAPLLVWWENRCQALEFAPDSSKTPPSKKREGPSSCSAAKACKGKCGC